MPFEEPPNSDGLSLDLSGNDFHGSCESGRCPAAVVGPVGMAARFDGLNDLLEIPDRPELRFDTGMTVSLWATNEGGGLTEASVVFGKAFGNQDLNSYEFYLSGQADRVLRWSMDAAPGLAGAASVLSPFSDAAAWAHLVGTWDGDAMILYIDGVEVGVQTGVSTEYDSHPLTIGGDMVDFAATHFWTGSVDELRIYDRPLDAIEVTLLYEEGLR